MSSSNVIRGQEMWSPISEKSLGIQIYESLLERTDDIAFVDALTGAQLSYGRLLEKTCRLAESLKNAGYKENDVVSISCENNINYFIPVVAALYLGIISAPLNYTYTDVELLHVMNISKPKLIFCSNSTAGIILSIKDKLPFIEKIIILESDVLFPGVENIDDFIDRNSNNMVDVYNFKPIDLNPFDHIAVIFCSSGTTGMPKCVMTTHDNISMRNNHACDPRLFMATHEVILGVLPFYHGFGFTITIAAFITRNKTVVLKRFNEDLFLSCIEKYKISTLYMVPPLMIFLAKSPKISKYDMSSVVEISCAAAPLSEQTENEVKRRLSSVKMIRQGYGLTETTLAVLLIPIGFPKAGSSGKVVPGISCIIRDPDTGKHLGPNAIGELCFKGRLVMKGYYGNAEATKNAFSPDGWLLTGDLGYYNEEGYFYIVDRLKELIKYKGFQVPPAELEAILLTHPKIKDVGVVGLPDDNAGELPLAFVVKMPGIDISEEEIKEFVRSKVSGPKQLRGGVHFVKEIPKTPSGKILRRDLRKMTKDQKSKL